ncbi:MAG: rod shape-determining protein RodA [Hyphomicrobiaceae bacterium]
MSVNALPTAVRRPLTLLEKVLRVDWIVLLLASLVAGVGLATLYSVAGGSFHPLAERHALRFLVGVGLVLLMALVPPRVWIGLAYPVYVVAVLALVLVALVGAEAMGARRWIALSGGLTFQPSELMKVALIAALARYYQWLAPARVSEPLWLLPPLALIALPVLLTLRQPDLGTAVLFALVGLGMMFLAGVNWLYFATGAIAVVIATPFIWDGLHDYQRRRIEVFLDPDRDPLGSGYHITQSKIALGSGGIDGKGFMQGSQSHLDFLPEKHTDFAFTMFGEEWGFVGAILLIALYASMIGLLMLRAAGGASQFARLVTAGAAMTLFIYVFINIAMVTGLVPVVGVPLPLVSYGGSAMLSLMAALGLAMSVKVHGRDTPRRTDIGGLW